MEAVDPVDAYLKIAEEVLRAKRRPLSPRAILNLAYLSELVPAHLYGKTQHKTLQARLSEDILLNRERSMFFRTAPGRFFLREFMRDTSLPHEHRTPIVARRRVRDWHRGPALAFKRGDLLEMDAVEHVVDRNRPYSLIKRGKYSYVDPGRAKEDDVFACSFVAVVREMCVLSYRVGRYREDRDGFFNRRSLGFYTLIGPEDQTFFSAGDAGIALGGIRATKLDLDLVQVESDDIGEGAYPRIDYFVYHHRDETPGAFLISLVRLACPDWYEPLQRRLAINDLQWLNLQSKFNHLEDFEPWSRSLADKLRSLVVRNVSKGL